MHGEVMNIDEHAIYNDATDVFGFWLYILTDCILFASLFAVFLVLNYSDMPHGPTLKHYVNLSDVFIETMLLLASNFTYCLSILNMYQKKLLKAQVWLLLTFLLGASFIFIEVSEFIHLAHEGFRWDINAHASSFFTLVGTHGLHVSIGLLWILSMIIQIPFLKASHIVMRRMTYLGLFWNFLDIVWIFVFTIVYLMGAM